MPVQMFKKFMATQNKLDDLLFVTELGELAELEEEGLLQQANPPHSAPPAALT